MQPMVLGRPHSRRLARLGRSAAVGLLVLLAVTGAGYGGLLRCTRFVPPAGTPPRTALSTHSGRWIFGQSSLERRGGIWVMHLRGSPYEMGYAHGVLGSRLIAAADDHLFEQMARFVPSSLSRLLILLGVRVRYRHLDRDTPETLRQELAGLAAAFPDPHRDFLPTYQRLLYYHALHDITQGLEHSPLLGCSALAAVGGATSGGGAALVGRNFDFEGGDIFDRDKAVIFFHPEGPPGRRIPFASVAWVGLIGAVTGINAEGIYVSVNAARSDDPAREGTPVAFVVRQLLERARSLDDAIATLRSIPVLVPDIYLLVDGKARETAVVERSPSRFAVRRSQSILFATNHMLAPEFARDAENDRLKRYLTSGYRHRRLGELVERWRGSFDPRRVQEVLRDRRGLGGVPLGPGNRNAIDALIATHSVIADAASMLLWVAEAPHTLGRYRAFDLRAELLGAPATVPPADLPEDPWLGSLAHDGYLQARAALEYADQLAQRGELAAAIRAAQGSLTALDDSPEPHWLLAELYQRTGDTQAARRELRRFLELHPPLLERVERARAELAAP